MAKASNHDEYIDAAADWAQPILKRIRKAFNKAGKLKEEMKWSAPHFTRNGILGGMAAFKQHIHLTFWRAAELDDPTGRMQTAGRTAIGYIKIGSQKDLPSEKQMVALVKQAIKIDGSPASKPAPKKKRPPARAPADLLDAVKANRKAEATWEKFPPSHKREFIEWIVEAKRDETRARRIQQAVEMMKEGKDKNWKYRK